MEYSGSTTDSGDIPAPEDVCANAEEASGHPPAEVYCTTCLVNLCGGCWVDLHRSKAMSSHRKLDMSFARMVICKHHPGKLAEYVCDTDEELLCISCCIDGLHAAHPRSNIAAASARSLQELSRLQPRLEQGIAAARAAVDCCAAQMQELNEKYEEGRHQLTEFFNNLILELTRKKSEVETSIRRQWERNAVFLQASQQSATAQLEVCKTSLDEAMDVLEHEPSVQTILVHNSIKQRLQSIPVSFSPPSGVLTDQLLTVPPFERIKSFISSLDFNPAAPAPAPAPVPPTSTELVVANGTRKQEKRRRNLDDILDDDEKDSPKRSSPKSSPRRTCSPSKPKPVSAASRPSPKSESPAVHGRPEKRQAKMKTEHHDDEQQLRNRPTATPSPYTDSEVASPIPRPASRSLASSQPSEELVNSEVIDDMPVTLLQGHGEGVESVSWSPDGAHLISASWDKSVRIWDAGTGAELEGLRRVFDKPVLRVSWSPDGGRVGAGHTLGMIRVWEIMGGGEEVCLGKSVGGGGGAGGSVNSLSWSREGRMLATAGAYSTVRIWDTYNGDEVVALQANEGQGGVGGVAWSNGGASIAAGVNQGVVFWDSNTWQPMGRVDVKGGGVVRNTCWSPGDDVVAFTAMESSVRKAVMADVRTNVVVGTLTWGRHTVQCVTYSATGDMLAIGSHKGVVGIFDVRKMAVLKEMEGHRKVSCLAWSPDGSLLASGGNDRPLCMWHVSHIQSS